MKTRTGVNLQGGVKCCSSVAAMAVSLVIVSLSSHHLRFLKIAFLGPIVIFKQRTVATPRKRSLFVRGQVSIRLEVPRPVIAHRAKRSRRSPAVSRLRRFRPRIPQLRSGRELLFR